MFPVEYEDDYYAHAVHGIASMPSWAAAVQTAAGEVGPIVGFLVACYARVSDLSAVEKSALEMALMKDDVLLHLLTFGVDPVSGGAGGREVF